MERLLIDIRDENTIIRKYFDGKDLISVDDLLNAIDELIYEKDYLEEEIEDMKQDIEDNYRPIPYAEQVGISDRDFM